MLTNRPYGSKKPIWAVIDSEIEQVIVKSKDVTKLDRGDFIGGSDAKIIMRERI
jgi:hypothetical protein